MTQFVQPRFLDIHILNKDEKDLLTKIGKSGSFFPQMRGDKCAADQLRYDGWVDITPEGGYVLSRKACLDLAVPTT
jgi:hypothetical protein